jgi:hypothetical protein
MLSIRDSNNRVNWKLLLWIWQKYNTHATVKEQIYEQTLTNIDNELYCYSNEFHSHVLFDRLWLIDSTLLKVFLRHSDLRGFLFERFSYGILI